MSILASSIRASVRRVATTSSRPFSATQRTLSYPCDSSASSSSSSSTTNTFRNVAKRAQAEASDESIKTEAVYTLLLVSVVGAWYLTLSNNEDKTLAQKDLL
ncbi:hypothetical protein EG328_007243 [Venturia inaequalis]|uniref:Uncharacterized protein n=1 Tax=Venturia inaequalis TaxID=5025 RepID=A0A8H3VWK1_VENIN|nr:hypothetical protein EG328_007243 [Venturia inaequalis]KAE9994188.1 hypothetical protein EG327_000895 [Venturia inaequalis]RDI78648.1 hypothetical protein Vi05172_g11312 [Venturia inaequalis]